LVLINRLHQNVIRSGLKKINLSYSRVSFEDIRVKLNLGKEVDIGLIVAKAIKDKVLSGRIDLKGGILDITENKDLYSTNQPQMNYQKRINYCLNLHDSACKALMYPADKENRENNAEGDDDDLEGIIFNFDDDFL